MEWVDWTREAIEVPNTIEFSSKSHKPRTLPLLPQLRDWLASLGRTTGPVLESHRLGAAGRPVGDLKKRVEAIREALGQPRTEKENKAQAEKKKTAKVRLFNLYDARHTFASQLLAAGVPLPEVQAAMGHSDIRTTMAYSHSSPDYLANVRKSLGAALGETIEPPQLRVVGENGGTPRAPRKSLQLHRVKR